MYVPAIISHFTLETHFCEELCHRLRTLSDPHPTVDGLHGNNHCSVFQLLAVRERGRGRERERERLLMTLYHLTVTYWEQFDRSIWSYNFCILSTVMLKNLIIAALTIYSTFTHTKGSSQCSLNIVTKVSRTIFAYIKRN